MKYDVVALGELLIDFTENGVSAQGNPLFEANPGGAPGNVLAMLARLGRSTAFIGKVGADMFGGMLLQTLGECGIDTRAVAADPAANTALAFVKNEPGGDRAFSFFRKPGADTLLAPTDVPAGLLENTAIFHFGSLSLTHLPARDATQYAVQAAKRAGAILSFDPNLRPLLWDDLEEARRQIAWGCGVCDILKMAEEELLFTTGADSVEQGAALLRQRFPGVRLLFVTRGKKGSLGFWGGVSAHRPAFAGVPVVDTTGAGDTFCGCCLALVRELDLDRPDKGSLSDMLAFGNAAAALVCTKKGAIRSMPSRAEIEQLARRQAGHAHRGIE